VERERARMRFRSASYSDIEGRFSKESPPFGATLVAIDGTRLATGRDFDESGKRTASDVVVLDPEGARGLVARLAESTFIVKSVDEKPYKRTPYPPFMTSTLQQEAGRKLRYTTQRTMSVAQRLYENGYITYMRTDSTALSETALNAARRQAAQLYGADYVPAAPRRYEKKVKNAQEAHEAIRPAGDSFRMPDQVAREVAPDEAALYELIWKRTIASQMADVRGKSVQVRITGRSSSDETAPAQDVEFSAGGKVIEFPGFLRAYVEGSDDPNAELEDREVRLPALAVGDTVTAESLEPKDHTTQPPARFTEASLVKALEEMGVGRPSTYASIIATIQDRGYVWKKGSALVPSFTAFAVVNLLESHFGDLVDYAFTARMEDDLDGIAGGSQEAQPWLSKFYFGNGSPGLRDMVKERLEAIDPRAINSIPLGTDPGGKDVVVRVGRYGPYLSRDGETAAVPEGIAPDELTIEKALELLATPSGDRVLGEDPATGLPVIARAGRFGPYVQLGEADSSSKKKPHTSSLLKNMNVEQVTLDDALRLLSLPRSLGKDPADGAEITVQNGRYGPYVKKGTDSRSLEDEEQMFTITLEDALAVLAQPKARGRRGTAAPPLKELGDDPVSKKPMVVKEGRFGPYVTDGETNASLRSGDDVESLTPERGAQLLQDKRDKGPAPPKRKAAAKRKK
jgi:DNA topoisomerase-1